MPSGGSSAAAPTVLTRRGRLVASILVMVAAVGAVLAVQTLSAGSTPPEDLATGQGAMTSQSTPDLPTPGSATTASPRPTDTASTTGFLLQQEVAPSATELEPEPVVVNGRTQPPLVEVPPAASGRLVPVGGSTAPVTGERVWTYRVEVEQGLPFDGQTFAAEVHATLSDARGWAAHGNVFQRVDGDDVDFRLILASPALTDRLCAPLRTNGQVSCRNGDLVVLNALRWAEAVEYYGGDVASYREYQVNHEVGHRLGRSHVECPVAGEPAPVMMQQTYGLDGCEQNAWPLADE